MAHFETVGTISPAFAGILKPDEVDDILNLLHFRDLVSDTRIGATKP